MIRYLAVWWRLLRLVLRHQPGATITVLSGHAVLLASVPASAVALRAAIDAGAGRDLPAAVLAAVGVAIAYTLNLTAGYLAEGLAIHLTDRVGLLVLDREIQRDVCLIETMDHLERTDFLDRITVLSGASWNLLFSMWAAVVAVFGVLQLVILLVLLGTVDPLLLGLVVFAVVPLWFDARGQAAVARAEVATAEEFRLQRQLFRLATSADSGKEIRVNGAAAELARLQEAAWQAAQRGRIRARFAHMAWQIGGWSVFTAAFAVALAIVVNAATTGTRSVGDVVLAVSVAVVLRQAVGTTVFRATQASGSASRLVRPYLWLSEYAAAERARVARTRPAPTRLREGIVLDRVSYRYPGTDRDAVREVSVRLPAGAVVAVVGEYGSGKTTLVKLLCRFHQPTAGRILMDGIDLAEIDSASWWAGSSVAFQDFGRYHTTLQQAVGLGSLPHLQDVDRVTAALREAGGADLLARLPDGLGTELGREFGGVDLSEGQWQKTALARACMRDEPVLFLLDEPTASLDAPSERAIFERYLRRARHLGATSGAVTLIVSHRFSTVAGADLILVMRDGALVEAGPHEELVRAGGLYAQLYRISERSYAMPTSA